jgi:hypothetical protein
LWRDNNDGAGGSTRRPPGCVGNARELHRGKKGKNVVIFLLAIVTEGLLKNRAGIFTPYALREREY